MTVKIGGVMNNVFFTVLLAFLLCLLSVLLAVSGSACELEGVRVQRTRRTSFPQSGPTFHFSLHLAP